MGSEVRPTPAQRLRVIVLGYVVRGPLGGMVWSNLHFLMGLLRLGHDVYFVEDSDDYPSCYDPSRLVTDTDPSYGMAFATRVLERVGMGQRWAYYDAHTSRWLGPCAGTILAVCHSADLVLDLCGVNPLRPWLLDAPVRVLVDEDPAFTQVRHCTDPTTRAQALAHTAFFSFGENIGRSGCTVPDDALPWQSTRQPLVADAITPSPAPRHGRFSTVMQWESYPAREHLGVRYGTKSDSFLSYLDLPAAVGPVFEIAVGGAGVPLDLLREKGWNPVDPLAPTRDPWTYQAFIERSAAEFSVAKHAYVATRSGWFSERSVAYLATGRPVVVQDTGFSDWLRVDRGVVPFTSFEEARAGVEGVRARYALHCEAAREVAVEYFDYARVLPALLERATAAPGRAEPTQGIRT